jgi:acetyltransferase-like isoleucine patch superfamily enzyme
MVRYLLHKLTQKFNPTGLKNTNIGRDSKCEGGSLVINTNIGDHSYCGYNCKIINCEIGNFCSIANNVIIGGGHHPYEWVTTSPAIYRTKDSIKFKFAHNERANLQPTKIQHDVWIGERVLIRQGITIKTGVVIGMGSVVTKDCEPYGIYAGNPARLIKYRFDETIRQSLLKSEWWSLDEAKLKEFGHLTKDPERFVTAVREMKQ